MPYKRIFRILTLLFVATCFFALHLAAQDAPSVAEAARRARQQKETASKPAQVVTNDSLTPAPANPPGEAPGAPAQAESSTPAASESAAQAENPPPAASTQNPERIKKEVESLKQEIANKQRIVTDLQREIALEQDIVYRNPDYQHDTAGKQKLDSLQSDLKQNQDDLAALKAKLTDLAGAEEPKESAPSQP
jgi:predicted RNase H-like nuclease (RuvC/YqgF family)